MSDDFKMLTLSHVCNLCHISVERILWENNILYVIYLTTELTADIAGQFPITSRHFKR